MVKPAVARPRLAETLGALLVKADAAKGQAVAKGCVACHDLTKGGPNKTGPNLWDVVMRPHGSHEGYGYSARHGRQEGRAVDL